MHGFFDYFQIAALVLFLSVFFGKTLYLRVTRKIDPVRMGAGKKGLHRFIERSFPVIWTLWIFAVITYSLHGEPLMQPRLLHFQITESYPLQLIGAGLIVIGLIIFIGALISFGNSWRVGIDERTPGKLVTTGAFAVSRNPVFLFFDLYFTGTFLINGTLLFLFFAVLVTAVLHYQILQEEKFLARAYGHAYEEYRARTARYLSLRYFFKFS